MSFAFEKTLRISLGYKLVQAQYRECQYGLYLRIIRRRRSQYCRLGDYVTLLYLPTQTHFPIGGERVTRLGLKLANSQG